MQIRTRSSSKQDEDQPMKFFNRNDQTLPAILEFQSPSAVVLNSPMPRAARGSVWIIGSLVLASVLAFGIIKVDEVVTASGKVVPSVATMVVQPLETAIVRSIEVREGEAVRAGQVLAQLDPTFAAADLDSQTAQVATLKAQVARLQAELNGRTFAYSGTDADSLLQAAIFGQRQAEYQFKLENYRQKAESLGATIRRANDDAEGFRQRLAYARSVETMRKELENLQVGSKLNTLAAMDSRAEMQRNLDGAEQMAAGAQKDLAALLAERDGYMQNWRSEVGGKLAEATSNLSNAREALRKAQLRRQLVELRADRDATVLTVAKVSVGSVLQSGQQLFTLVPAGTPLEVEVNIAGRDDGFVHPGDPVAIKFDTFPFTQYGMAQGTVRTVSADSFTAEDDARTPTGAVPLAPGSTEPYYRARIAVEHVDLHNVPAGFSLAPGMPVTADVKVGRRTILDYLIGRVMPLVTDAMRER
jgi:hemolysin D